MATKAGVGMSYHHNPNVAGREAAEQALQKAGISKPDFVFVFGSMGYDQRSLVRAVREATGGAPLTGCSAEGTINGEDADESNFSVVVSAISSDDLHWHNGLATGLEADPRAVGKRVAKELLPHLSTDTIGLFVFPDGLKDFIVPTENLVDNFFAGLEENLPSERFLPLWGGGAGNNFNDWASPPYQYCDDEVITDGVSYALLSGKAQVGWAISHACIPIGGERIVTRSEGNIIYEIDGKPAMEVFKEYIPEGTLTDDRDWFPYAVSLSLCFKAPSYMKDEEYVVRGICELLRTVHAKFTMPCKSAQPRPDSADEKTGPRLAKLGGACCKGVGFSEEYAPQILATLPLSYIGIRAGGAFVHPSLCSPPKERNVCRGRQKEGLGHLGGAEQRAGATSRIPRRHYPAPVVA